MLYKQFKKTKRQKKTLNRRRRNQKKISNENVSNKIATIIFTEEKDRVQTLTNTFSWCCVTANHSRMSLMAVVHDTFAEYTGTVF